MSTAITTAPLQADLVIIGAGGAGLPAAVQAFEQGAKRVVLLEKRKTAGGNAVFASGIYAIQSPIHRQMMIDIDPDQVYKKTMAFHHHARANGRIVRDYINNSGDTIRWLMDRGIQFEVGPEMQMYFGQDPTWHIAMNPATGDVSRFAQVFRKLQAEIKEKGGQFLFETECKTLLKDAQGRICGLIATRADGSEFEIQAPAVIISTGGFIGNKELLKRYFPYFDDKFGGFYVAMQGEGIGLTEQAGGAVEDYATLVKEAPGSSDEMSERALTLVCREPYSIWVNKLGRRFSDETIGFSLQTCTNAVLNQPEKQAWTLLDDAMLQDIIDQGWKLPRYPGMGTDKKVREQLNSAAEKGQWATKGDNWGDIAAWIGAAPDALQASVDEYNGFCDKGYDQSFAKDRRFLRRFSSTGPYYAVRFTCMIIETCGPVRVNEKMEVLDAAFHPVPGLYAAGALTTGWQGHDYCGDHLFGTALGYSMNSGRIAGREALAYAQR